MVYLYIVAVIVTLYALIDCLRTPTDKMPKGLPKMLWLLIIMLFTIVGPLAWIVISWAARAEEKSEDGIVSLPNPLELFNRGEEQPQAQSKMVPPDENPDFLFSLEAQIRRQKMAEEELKRKENRGKNGEHKPENN